MDKKIKEAAKVIATEEHATTPHKSYEEIEQEVLKTLVENQKNKKERANNIIGGLNKIEVMMNNGGIKGVAMKGLMYVVLPFILLTGLGYLIYQGVTKRRVILNFVKGMNNSPTYQDKKTKWKLRVRELIPEVIDNKDKENFESVKQKVKEVYGL